MISGLGQSGIPSVAMPPRLAADSKSESKVAESKSMREEVDFGYYAETGKAYHSRNAGELGMTLKAFGQQLDLTTSRMRMIRPDIADAEYDLKLEQGHLKVVGDSLDDRSRIWLEESLNGNRELVRLAKDFNELGVEVLDPKGENAFDTKYRHYDKLDATIDRTTRFVSLLNKVASTRPLDRFSHEPYYRAAGLLEEQVMADTYEYQAKGGTIELMRRMESPSFYARF